MEPTEVGVHKLFVFKDTKSSSYGPPMSAQTKGMFIRDLQDGFNEGRAVWAKHPNDFAIFEIGEYNLLTGEVKQYDAKQNVGLVSDLVVKQ